MPFKTDINEIEKRFSEKLFQRIASSKAEIEAKGTQYAQESYYKFPKPPIDTRRSIGLTTMELKAFFKRILLVFKIGTDYADQFRFGLGVNEKYLKRDPLQLGARYTLTWLKSKFK